MSQLYSQDLYGAETYSQATTSTAAGSGSYNEMYYNENTYNAAILFLALFETLTTADAETMSDAQALNEAITIADTLQRYFAGQILSESVTPSDVLLNQAQIAKLDLLSITDDKVIAVLKVLLETMTLSEVRTMVMSVQHADFILLVDNLTKQITNKRVSETLRLQDWLSMRKNPPEGIWGN